MQNIITSPTPLLGFAAYSGTGKTTLLCKIIPLLKNKGIRIGIVKHSHHNIDIDHPKKDSFKLRQAGATETMITSQKRTAIIMEHPDNTEQPTLQETLQHMHTDHLDLILVEGFKHTALPKIELHRKALDKPYIYPNDNNIIAIALDHPLEDQEAPQQLALNKPQQIADFIEKTLLKQA